MNGSGGAAPVGLRRALGTGLLAVLVVGDILGAGIYVLVGEVAADVGGLVWLPFLLAFLLAGLTATSYAELVTAHPHASGSARYVEVAFGRPWLTFGVGLIVVASAVSTAAVVSRAVGGQYLSAFTELPVVPVALGTIVLLSVLVWVGISESARANAAMTVVEVGGLLLVVVAGVAGFLDGSAEPGRLLDTGSTEVGAGAVVAATALAFFAYLGFEDAVHLAEEVRDPRRAFPRAILGGLAVVGVLYLAVTVAAGALAGGAELAESDAPLLAALDHGPIPVDARVFAVIAVVAVANTALLALTTASRQLYGLAEQGAVPAVLGRVGRRHTPVVAVACVGGAAGLLASTGSVRELADTTVVLLLVVFTLVNATVVVLRRRARGTAPATPAPADADAHAPFGYRAPRGAAAVGATGSAALLVDTLVVGGAGLLARLAVVAVVGTALYLAARRGSDRLSRVRSWDTDDDRSRTVSAPVAGDAPRRHRRCGGSDRRGP